MSQTTEVRPSTEQENEEEQRRKAYEETWGEPTRIPYWFGTVDNVTIGTQYLVTAFTFFLIGGALALLMRIQLAVPENTFLGPQTYNRLFTMHGSTMMYLFAVPFMEGLATLLIPLILGARDLAYPRLTALGFWTFFFSGMTFYAGFLFDMVPEAGWFAYTPLSAPAFASKGIDFWLLGLGMAELAGIAAGAELCVSIVKLRAPGMTLGRMPLYGWAWLATAVMIVFAFTTLLMATVLLELDHAVGTQFFNTEKGGNHLLWQHLFWFFGHPEVYIIFLPATGIVSMIVSASSRRILGYTPIVVAIIATGFISYGLWVHHMYTTGLPELSLYFFAGASLMIAVASGVQVFAWIGSLWGRRPKFHTPLLHVLGFIVIFVIGGFTGVMVAVVPFDWQVHDTFFLVAHFHYVLIGGAVFPALAGMYYWGPKITGRMFSERLGKWSFWLLFIGFNVTFFPMHMLGFDGMPRRVYTFPAGLGLDLNNMIATVGAFVLAAGFLLFVVNVLYSLKHGEEAGDNPWGSDSLEWTLDSPPAKAMFPHLPVVYSRHPLWEEGEPPQRNEAAERAANALRYRPEKWRATLVTDGLTGQPQAIARLAGPSYMPFLTAFGVTISSIGGIARWHLLTGLGAAVAAIAVIVWLWPDRRELEMMRQSRLPEETGLPIFTTGTKSLGWWGMLFFLVSLGTSFLTVFYTYFYLRLYSEQWPQGGLPLPELGYPALIYLLLPAAAAVQAWSERTFHREKRNRFRLGLIGVCVLGIGFVGLQVYSLFQLGFTPQTNAYASAFFTLSGLLDLAVLTGLVFAGTCLVRSWQISDDWRLLLALHVQMNGMFWYFIAAVGALAYVTLYVSPHVI